MPHVTQIISLFIVGSMYSITGIFIGRKLYNNIKNEKHQEKGKVIQRIMKTYALVQCVVTPALTITAWLLYVNKNALNVVQPFATGYIIKTSRFLYVWFRVYIGFNSLIIAACRYCFIVKDSLVSRVGIERTRYIFLTTSVAVPVVLALSNEATLPIESAWICMFMPNDNDAKEIKNTSDIFCSKDIMVDVSESPIYNLLHAYLSPQMMFCLQICHKIILFIATSNIIEGILYIHTFLFIRREENKPRLQSVLSETSKQKRRRRNAVNLQMTIFAWSLEFVTGLVNLSIGIKIHNPESNVDFITCMVISDGFLNFIIIPSSYILNSEELKIAIIESGWFQSFRQLILSNNVEPLQNEDVQQENAPPDPPDPQPRPISSVSGNIKALQSPNKNLKKELDKDFKTLTSHNIFSSP